MNNAAMNETVMNKPGANAPVIDLSSLERALIGAQNASRLSLAEAPLRASAGFARPVMDRDAVARQLRLSLGLAGLLVAGCLMALLSAWAPLA